MVAARIAQCPAGNWQGMQDWGLIPGQDVEKPLCSTKPHEYRQREK